MSTDFYKILVDFKNYIFRKNSADRQPETQTIRAIPVGLIVFFKTAN